MISEHRSAAETGPTSRLGVRSAVLRSLQPENRVWLVVGWLTLLLFVALILFSPLYLPVASVSGTDGQSGFDELSDSAKQLVAEPTEPERKRILDLSLMKTPLPPAAPPPQSGQAAPIGELFGVPSDQSKNFAKLTADLRQSEPDCARWMGSSLDSGQAPTNLASAQTALDSASSGATKERAVFHYHQGLIQLCGPNGPSAVAEFQAAQTAYAEYAKEHGGRDKLPKPDSQRLAQYETVTAYGLGLAQLAGLPEGKRPDQIDKTFQDALSLAARIRPYAPAGPFVKLSGCPPVGRECDLFLFSTASIYNARLYAWLAAGLPKEAFARTTQGLAAAPTYVAAHPDLAANFAAAAAGAGHLGEVRRIFDLVRADLDNNGATSAAWRDDPAALARLVALATVAGEPAYDASDDWWPQAAAVSKVRARFEESVGRPRQWFPAIDLKSPVDQDSIDLWLWLNRDRALLQMGSFDLFRQDGVTIASLAPADRDFVSRWRRTVTAELGNALMAKAEIARRNGGVKAAAPLLTLIAGGDFPLTYRWMAKVTLASNKPAGSVLLEDGIILGLIVLMAMVHLDLNIGYSRTFTRRHYLHRTKAEGADGLRTKGAQSP